MTFARDIEHWLSSKPWIRKTGIGRRVHALLDMVYVTRHRIPYRDLYPHFLIIGAQKSGTTSLHYYLGQHPDIFMTAFKETNLMLADTDQVGDYFRTDPKFYGSSDRQKRRCLSDEQILRKMLRGYSEQPLIGDASPYYSFHPLVGADVPRKAKRIRSDMKIIYILRHPIERIASNYHHDMLFFERKTSMDDWMESYRHGLDASSYATQLKHFLEVFDRKMIWVLTLEDLKANPNQALSQILEFLELSPEHSIDTSVLFRASPEPIDIKSMARSQSLVTERVYDLVAEKLSNEVAELEQILERRFVWDLSKRYCVG